MLDDLQAQCAAHGFDLVQPFRLSWYNDAIEPAYKLPDFGRPDALAVLIANSRALWPHFMAAEHAAAHPLDSWIVDRISAVASGVPARTALWFPHEPPPRLLPFQRLAQLAGLAWLSPSWLLAHPIFGPWISLRAVMVIDAPGPAGTAPQVPDPCGRCDHGCLPPFNAAMEGQNDWRQWLAVRDACPLGREHRFSEHQLRYHYTKDLAGLCYQPYWCEENIWRLARTGRFQGGHAVFISSPTRQVALWSQRASDRDDGLTVWDYHVVLAHQGHVWDADCRAGMPLRLDDWLAATFPYGDQVPEPVRPMFRLVPLERYQTTFASDRSHMLKEDGSWAKPPPPWPPIGAGMNLMRFVAMEDPALGPVTDLSALRHHLSGDPRH